MLKHICIYIATYSIICTAGYIFFDTMPAYARGKGNIRRLTGIAASMDRMEKQADIEARNYQKANDFLDSSDIKAGISYSDITHICGEPVAEADNGNRLVYKPPTSSFFQGEKIYFYFDKDKNLIDWEKVYQK